MYSLNIAFAETATQSSGSPSMIAGLTNLLPMILIFAIFYFLLIRPQTKKQKKLQEMVNNLKKGDTVVVAGGIVGTISSLDEKFVNLLISQQNEMKVLRSSVNEVVTDMDENSLPKKSSKAATDKKTKNKNTVKKKITSETKKKTTKEE